MYLKSAIVLAGLNRLWLLYNRGATELGEEILVPKRAGKALAVKTVAAPLEISAEGDKAQPTENSYAIKRRPLILALNATGIYTYPPNRPKLVVNKNNEYPLELVQDSTALFGLALSGKVAIGDTQKNVMFKSYAESARDRFNNFIFFEVQNAR